MNKAQQIDTNASQGITEIIIETSEESKLSNDDIRDYDYAMQRQCDREDAKANKSRRHGRAMRDMMQR